VHPPSLTGTKALFSFDGEYSVVALDFDVVGRKTITDAHAVKTRKDLEGIEGLKFACVFDSPHARGCSTQASI
jgi:hypothetical protein